MCSKDNINLGEDLEIEILWQLPAKSLMRFRCVRKSWNILITSHFFVTGRSKLQIHENTSLLVLYTTPNVKFLLCDRDDEKPMLTKSVFSNNVATIKFYGSCNGVFCLKGIYPYTTHHNELIMWNPTTNQVHFIPPAPSLGNCYIDESLYGFGAVNNDFKVVKLNISTNHGRTRMLYLLSAEVYNINTKSWTPIINHPPVITVTRQDPPRYNTLVNGVYHWITVSHRSNASNILCFDFHNNQFQQLQAPYSRYLESFFFDDVAVIQDSLGYVVQHRFSTTILFEIWTREQNGWSKKYNIDPFSSMFKIFGPWSNGDEILIGKVGQVLRSYDRHGNALRQFQIDILENECFWIYEFVPSIALLLK
ncbi:unnamed protein product [Lathyrus sativus]|nr:unnamed protein product [Lathyrus sativus]